MFRKANIFYPLIRTRTCVYQRVRNVGFSEYFAYALNEWSLTQTMILWKVSVSTFRTTLNILYILLTAGLEIFGNSKKNIGCQADQCKICALQFFLRFFLSITWHKWFSIFHVAMQTNHVKAEYENSVKPTAVSGSFKHILKPLKTLKIHTWQTQTP